MNARNFTHKRLTTLAVALCLTFSAVAQVSIRVEESTAPVVRTEDATIDIQMPRSGEQRVILTTATEARTTDPADANSRINLTPTEFLPPPAPLKEPVEEPAPATTDTDPTDPARAETPAPTERSVLDETESPETVEPAGLAPTSPAAESTTTSESEVPELGVDKKGTDYLPPADLAGRTMLQREGVDIPLRPELLTSAPLDVTVPDVFETTLTNGIRFYHYENRDLPRVRVTMLIEAGQNVDPADKVGLAELTVRTIRSGGAAGRSGDEVDQQLEQIGSDLEFKVDRDHVAGTLFALTENASEAMKLLADVLMKPEFEKKKFEQQRARALEELRRQNDQPADISRREFRKIIYGVDHPLARTPTTSSLTSITLDDVRAFHEARFRPSTLWIGISGDITQEDARSMVETAFGAWNRSPAEDVPMPEVVQDDDTTAGVYLTKKATAQSQIRLGHLGLERRSPKAYAANVLNSIYGMGGFSSRLMNQVRTKHGYVYGVGGGIFSDDPIGLFAAIAASQAGTTAAAINEMISVTRGLLDEPISPAELETARRDVIFTFVTQFNTPHDTIAAHMLHDYRGYDEDYLMTFTERVRGVSAEDVKQVATDLIHPERLKIYVIGNEAELDEPLDQFGPVQEWSLEDYSGLE